MATLPTTPEGHELEEYFAALLQSTGHYVEKNIKEPNILELDIVATDYASLPPRSRLFEVKGTNARLEDIFKLVGHMRYLGIDEGAFVTTEKPKARDIEWFTGVCDRTNVTFVMVPDLAKAPKTFRESGFGRGDHLRQEIWRFSYWLERIYVNSVRDLRLENMTARAAINYYYLMNSGVFLTADIVDKVRKIYAAYQDHPTLMAELADEMAPPKSNGAALRTTALRSGAFTPLHATMYFEHRARLSLLKAAADYLLAGGDVDAADPDDITVDFGIADLPQSFLRSLGWLRSQMSYWLFPLFWQNFLWAWGGILPDEHRDEVLADVAAASGLLSIEHAQIALAAHQPG